MMIAISIGIICFTVVLLVVMLAPGISRGRDAAAYDRDRALAKLFEARADLMHVESMERRDAIRRRDAVDTRLKEVRNKRRRDKVAEEVRR